MSYTHKGQPFIPFVDLSTPGSYQQSPLTVAEHFVLVPTYFSLPYQVGPHYRPMVLVPLVQTLSPSKR